MIGTRRVAWLARGLLLGSLVVSGLTCDAFPAPTDPQLAVVVRVSADSIVPLKQAVRFKPAAATFAGPAPGAAFRWRSTAPGVAEGGAQVRATVDSIAGSACVLVGAPAAVALSACADTLPDLALTGSSSDSTVVRAISTDASSPSV